MTKGVNYDNIDKMYDLVYKQMVNSSIAVNFPESELY